ncbi:hypothetical protein BT96DRAFT_995151 [Gymnopus androsaceus JB14]|uniref:Uncharacterized protein n=1 Tax=Gymnopus androsaceus JB14 TaxID=1447944 RepID=A0A6A4HJ43_9AGAR|nr:hypothetical protein BT96DRAFT_995151 [Gymnopus androsaceus JB14]
MDHAADGKKKLKDTRTLKEQIAKQDLGREKMDDMTANEIIRTALKITEDDILKRAGLKKEEKDQLSAEHCSEIASDLLEEKIRKDVLENLPTLQKEQLALLVFAGCGAHKDLNAFKYGADELAKMWELLGLEGPCDLGSKGHDAAKQIAMDNNNTEALDRCSMSCPRGGVKLCKLAGALFRHKNGDTGYQDKHRIFMTQQKHEIHGYVLSECAKKFPDTSNVRYQSYSYAAVELVTYRDLYVELIEEIRDGKTKKGLNHMEENVLKGLSDVPTITELCAMALYGLVISWVYVKEIRGSDPSGNAKFVNALSPEMFALHRKVAPFCENLSLHPELLLNPTLLSDDADFTSITLDGRPLMDKSCFAAITQMKDELPHLASAISAKFKGASEGWTIFVSEYDEKNPNGYSSLPPELLELLGMIPMTNDPNEGVLGSLRQFKQFIPSSNAHRFSDQARARRNSTDNFVKMLCNDDDLLYVMRLARWLDASGEQQKFREKYLTLQKERAETARKKETAKLLKKSDENARLEAAGVITDREAIERMTNNQLKDQIKVHKNIVKDPVLKTLAISSLKNKALLKEAVFAAIDRYNTTHSSVSTSSNVEMEDDTTAQDANTNISDDMDIGE